MAENWPMRKQDSSWRRVKCISAVKCIVVMLLVIGGAEGKQMSETLQRALSAVRGPSPGAKKLLNIPEDGGMLPVFLSKMLSDDKILNLRIKVFELKQVSYYQ